MGEGFPHWLSQRKRASKRFLSQHPFIGVAIGALGSLFVWVAMTVGDKVLDAITQKFFLEDEVSVAACSPLKSAVLVVSSSNGNQTKIHSANEFPFLNRGLVVVENRSAKPVGDSRIMIRPVNGDSNRLVSVAMYTDNFIETKSLKVDEGADGSYLIELGNFINGQTLVFEATTLYPTGFLVEFSGSGAGARDFFPAGGCNLGGSRENLQFPNDFYSGPKNEIRSAKYTEINDVIAPVGEISFKIIYNYDCGFGAEQGSVSLGGSTSYCNLNIQGGGDRNIKRRDG